MTALFTSKIYPSLVWVAVIEVLPSGFVHSIRLITLLKNPMASLDGLVSSFNLGSIAIKFLHYATPALDLKILFSANVILTTLNCPLVTISIESDIQYPSYLSITS